MTVLDQFSVLGALLMEQRKAGDIWRKRLGEILRRPGPAAPHEQTEAVAIRYALDEAMKPYLETIRQMQAFLPLLNYN